MINQRSVYLTPRLALHCVFTHAKSIATVLILIAVSTTSVFAAEQRACGSRSELIKQLSKQYNEQPIALGLSSNGSLVEVLTNESGSTWTIMISKPNGPSCLVAAGEGWEEVRRTVAGERGA